MFKQEKRCAECQKIKPYTEFSPDKRSADGYYCYCKVCVRKKGRVWRANNTLEQKQKHIVSVKKWAKRNPGKVNAQNCLKNEIRYGRIKRQPCVVCGSPNSHAHH